MKRLGGTILAGAGAVALLAAACATAPGAETAAVLPAPAFDVEGRFVVPDNTNTWPAVGVTVAMQYEGDVGGKTINTVRMDPVSFETYVKTGVYPVGTMMELEIRRIDANVDPAREGTFMGALATHSIHIKDEKGGPGTWTFYGYPPGQSLGQPIARTANCYSCHDEHGTTDSTFTQFYPVLNDARAKAMAAHP